MIFHQHRCIFVQPPKCAGTSVMKSFGLDWNHPDAHLMNDVSSEEYRTTLLDYFRFSAVRNPFDRLISGWKYCDFTKNRPLLDVLRNPPRPLPTPADPRDPHTEFGAYHHIVRTQYDKLFSDGVLGVSFLMRYENLQADFDHVCYLVGKPECTLPHENRTQHEPYQKYLDHDPEAREIAERLFQVDLETFGYHY